MLGEWEKEPRGKELFITFYIMLYYYVSFFAPSSFLCAADLLGVGGRAGLGLICSVQDGSYQADSP